MSVLTFPVAPERDAEHALRAEAVAARDVAGALRRASREIPNASPLRREFLDYADDLATLARMRGEAVATEVK